MRLTRNLKFNPALFGVIPLVNVLFLVVLFFALSSRFVLQPGMAVTLPASAFTLSPRIDAQIVSVTAAPVPVIYHRDQPVSLEELRHRLAQTSVKERTIILKADKSTPYNLVVQITDAALKLGFSVVLATDSEGEMNTPPSEPDLTFHWPVEKGFPFILFVCVAGSLFAHAATFFLFQVVYPQRVTIPQPAPHVSLLTPSSPENIALLRWIEAEDPALIASDNAVPPPGLIEVRYRPSFAAPRTAPLGAPVEKTQEVTFPPAVDRIVVGPVAPAPAAPLASEASKTVVRYAGALATRPLIQDPPLAAARLAVEPIVPTVLLAGVNENGEVRYQLIQQPSGDPGLDNLAIAHLRRLNFAPASAPMTWGHITFAWGADAYVESGARAPRTP